MLGSVSVTTCFTVKFQHRRRSLHLDEGSNEFFIRTFVRSKNANSDGVLAPSSALLCCTCVGVSTYSNYERRWRDIDFTFLLFTCVSASPSMPAFFLESASLDLCEIKLPAVLPLRLLGGVTRFL